MKSIITSDYVTAIVFGNQALHLILKGTVRPHNMPFLKVIDTDVEFRSPTPENDVKYPLVS